MKAMIVRDFGGPDIFEAAELSKPELKAGHVLVSGEGMGKVVVDRS